ncbi:hypothetical protein [Pelagibaculum spongiae]|uniref:Type 4 fimbrial biogenesis protein PilX N-terminal domain-containing protein n=1 Tax=Pelagibaculum spongiae TaxID=2080658 RepID=A0A2V1H0R7_9GAMM|nr:hypothetical protein [Pelagibaculum spongiae]PVZ71550.1 hypothetical protein DC094_00455 [Pelagibaculum spongiae]
MNNIKKQQGFTLVLAMVLLLVIAFIINGVQQDNLISSREISNIKDQAAATRAANAAARQIERWLETTNTALTPLNYTIASCPIPCIGIVKPMARDMQTITNWAQFWETKGLAIDQMPATGVINTTNSFSSYSESPRSVTGYMGYDLADSRGRGEITDPEERSRHIGPHYYQINTASTGNSGQSLSVVRTTMIKRK